MLMMAALAGVAAGCVAAGPAGMVRRLSAGTADAKVGMTLSVDSIDCRQDLTRMYARLWGNPNTAHRIDSLQLSAGPVLLEATDIDGVDMERWFQWEEDGVIAIEIDFGPVRELPRKMTLRAVTPKGPVVWNIERR